MSTRISIFTWAEGEKTCMRDQRYPAHSEIRGVGRGARVGYATRAGMVGVGDGGRTIVASTHPDWPLTNPGVAVEVGVGEGDGDGMAVEVGVARESGGGSSSRTAKVTISTMARNTRTTAKGRTGLSLGPPRRALLRRKLDGSSFISCVNDSVPAP